MDLDPHTLQQIIMKISQQMRCPQCGKRIPVDFSTVRVIAYDALLLELRCESCSAFIVLHASLQGAQKFEVLSDETSLENASSALQKQEKDVEELRKQLQETNGEFSKIFQVEHEA